MQIPLQKLVTSFNVHSASVYWHIPLPGTEESNECGLGPALKNLHLVRLEVECELFTADTMGRASNLKSKYTTPDSAPPSTFFFQHLGRWAASFYSAVPSSVKWV